MGISQILKITKNIELLNKLSPEFKIMFLKLYHINYILQLVQDLKKYIYIVTYHIRTQNILNGLSQVLQMHFKK